MAYFGEAYMGRRRQQWLRSLAYVEAQTNGTWHRGTINQKKIEGEHVVVMATFPTLDSIACTINASRLIDTYGEQAAYQQRTINKVAGQGTMIKITIPIYEVTAYRKEEADTCITQQNGSTKW